MVSIQLVLTKTYQRIILRSNLPPMLLKIAKCEKISVPFERKSGLKIASGVTSFEIF